MGVHVLVGPFFQCRPDKAFRLAVSLGPVRSGSFMLYAKLPASIPKLSGFVARTVIRQYSFHFDAVRGIPGDGKPQKFYRRLRSLIRKYRRIGCPGRVIHADMQVLPSRPTAADLSCSRLFVPNSVNLAQPLDIQVMHLPRLFPLIALNRLFFLQGRKPGAAELAQGTEYTTAAKAQAQRNFIAGQPPFGLYLPASAFQDIGGRPTKRNRRPIIATKNDRRFFAT